MRKIIRRGEKQIKRILSKQIKSGLTVKEYCSRHELAQSTFWKWRKTFGKCTGISPAEKPVEFLELGRIPTATAPGIEICIGQATVRIKGGCDGQLTASVLSVLAGIC